MQIYIRMLTCKILHLNVEPSDTVESVKAQIFDKEGIDIMTHQRFIFAKKWLEDDKTLAEYDITEGSAIYLVLSLKERIQVFIKALTGWSTSVEVELSECVENLKVRISEKNKIPVSHFKLTLAGEELEDGKILSEYNLTKKSVIGLTFIKFDKED